MNKKFFRESGKLLGLGLALLYASRSIAASDGALYAGVGYFSENNFGKETTSSTAAKSTIGTGSLPFVFRYDWKGFYGYIVSPTFSYTLLTRSSAGSSAKVTTWHLSFPIGDNFKGTDWDWSVGPGVINRSIAGKGGTVVLSNGTGSSTFALPGRTVYSQDYTLTAEAGYNFSSMRLGFSLIAEGFYSSKQDLNLMVSWIYNFSDSGGGGSMPSFGRGGRR